MSTPPDHWRTPNSGLVGFRRGVGPVEVGVLVPRTHGASPDHLAPLADLQTFWSDPAREIARIADLRTNSPYALSIESVTLVPPVLPSARVFCIGLNYHDHVTEGSFAHDALPQYPTLFARWPASLCVSGTSIPVPPDEEGLDWEAEVVAYVGKPLTEVEPDDALAAVIGYSAFNDVTARRTQKLTSQWILGKNGDRSGPIGPIVPATEVGDLRNGLRIETRVNGTLVQSASTSSMIYTVGETLSFISRTVTLQPGDMLATGTPSGVGYARTPPWLMGPGDQVVAEVERIGSVSNTIVDHTHR